MIHFVTISRESHCDLDTLQKTELTSGKTINNHFSRGVFPTTDQKVRLPESVKPRFSRMSNLGELSL